MRILALDLAACTGWATRSRSGEVFSGVLDLSLGDDHPGARSLRVRGVLRDLATRHDPDLIVWERIVQAGRGGGSAAATTGLYSLETQLVEVAFVTGAETLTVMPSSLKKFATGDGRADKARMVLEARKKWPGWTPATHDEADARWVLLWAEQHQAAETAGATS